ncbi:hypothetical protein CR513_32128, partial [Mucuna pruriens]
MVGNFVLGGWIQTMWSLDLYVRMDVDVEVRVEAYLDVGVKGRMEIAFQKSKKPKSIAIQEAHDMYMLTLGKLFVALRVHEVHFIKRDKIKDNDSITLKAIDSKYKHLEKYETRHKGKALKVQTNFYSLDKSSSDSTNNEVSFMSKKLKMMLKKKGKYKHHSKKDKHNKQSKEKSSNIINFKCKKSEHIKVECPKLKKRYHHKKKKNHSNNLARS